MELNEGQSKCLQSLIHWWYHDRRHQQVFEISGAAGTGKTTIIRILIKELQLEPEEVLFMAYVGKAAMVLNRQGLNAKTIHASIYQKYEVIKRDDNGKPIISHGRPVMTIKFRKKTELGDGIKLIILDEAPMANEKISKDLLSFKIPVIALGDLNQLPPITGDSFFLKHPDIILTQIMRQRADNPIIKLSHDVLENPYMILHQQRLGDKVIIIKKHDFFYNYMGSLVDADMVICGRNVTRDILNTQIRKMVHPNADKDLIIGDKLICRKNNWDEFIDENIFLINGMIGTVTDIFTEECKLPNIPISFQPDFTDGSFEKISLNYFYFKASYQKKLLMKNDPYQTMYNFFEYGYCITCHLSQGSQYNTVILFAERMGGDATFFKQWLYTGISRAIDKLVIVI